MAAVKRKGHAIKMGIKRITKQERCSNNGCSHRKWMSFETNRGRGVRVVITRAGGIDPPAIMTALRVLVSSNNEWNAAGEAVGNFVTENSGGKENERLARLVAQRAVELELESKATTIEEDEALLQKMYDDMSQSSNADRLAVQFRIEKKKLLRETAFSFTLL